MTSCSEKDKGIDDTQMKYYVVPPYIVEFHRDSKKPPLRPQNKNKMTRLIAHISRSALKRTKRKNARIPRRSFNGHISVCIFASCSLCQLYVNQD